MSTQPFRGLGMWVWEAGQDDPEAFVRFLVANSFPWLAVKAHDGQHDFNDPRLIEGHRDACRRHGMKFGLWGYLSAPGSPDADMASACCDRFKPDFYIADAEVEYERAARPVSREFCQRFRERHPNLPAALSSFGRIDLHSIDWAAWRDHHFDWMPQAYECETTALAPSVCVEKSLSVWPRDRIFVTLGSYKGVRGVLSGDQLYRSVVGIPLPGVNVWDAQELRNGQVGALSRLAHHGAPPPPPAHVPVAGEVPVTRDLMLTSPLVRGADVQALQKGVNDRLHARGMPPIQADGQFGPLTHHAVGAMAYAIGLLDSEATKDVQRYLRWPWQRTPAQVRREHLRADEAAKAKRGAGGAVGVAAIPAIAATHIGVAESPPNSNWGHPYPAVWEEHFGMSAGPWCGAFAGSCVLAAGGHVTSRVVYCPYIEADARSQTNGFDRWESDHRNGVGPGWLVLYCWDGSGRPEHVGIVESLQADHLVAIEGNTSGTNPSDGGMVARMQRAYGYTVGYARPRL